MNRIARKRELAGEPAPSLPRMSTTSTRPSLGSWPLESEPQVADAYRERVSAYMIKAAREAKVRTSWTEIDAAHEEALVGFVRGVLELAPDNNLFLYMTCSSSPRQ